MQRLASLSPHRQGVGRLLISATTRLLYTSHLQSSSPVAYFSSRNREKGRSVRGSPKKPVKGSSRKWLDRQAKDPFVSQARASGYRSRASYKLLQMNDKYNILKPDSRVIDLGCAPGSWLQVCRQRCAKGFVIGVDLQEIEPISGVHALQGDITDLDTMERVKAQLQEHANMSDNDSLSSIKVDVVLSDMASASTGLADVDAVRTQALVEYALQLWCTELLQEGGTFVGKVITGSGHQDLLKLARRQFTKVVEVRPGATRKDSRELYLVASGFKGQ